MKHLIPIILAAGLLAFSSPAWSRIGSLSIADQGCGTVTLEAELDSNWKLITNDDETALRIRWIKSPIDQGQYEATTSNTTLSA